MSKALTATLTLKTKTTERKLETISRLINGIQASANRVSNSMNVVRRTTDSNVAATNNWNRSVTTVNRNLRESSGLVGSISNKLKGFAAAYLGVMGTTAAINSADSYIKSTNQLNTLNDWNTNTTQEQLDNIYAAAQRSRGDYNTFRTAIGKNMTLAGDAFGNDVNVATAFQETLAKSYKMGNSTAAEQASSMLQLTQALGSGKLQGDELKSLREGAALAAKEIENFAQEFYGINDDIVTMGSNGLLTSDLVVHAILNASDEIDAAFTKTSMTFGDVMTSIKNDAHKAFEPVSELFKEIINSEQAAKVLNGISNALEVIAGISYWLLKGFQIVFNFFVDNWDILQPIVVGVLLAIVAAIIYLNVWLTIVAIKATMAFLAPIAPMLLVIVIIGSIVAAIINLANGAKNGCDFIAKAMWGLLAIIVTIFMIVWIYNMITGAMLLSTPILILLLIIAVIAIIIAVIAVAGEKVIGVIAGALSVIWNLFVTLVMTIVKYSVLPMWQMFDAFANFLGNLFNDPIGAIIYGFQGLADTVLSILQTIANGIDAIFGSNLSDAVQGWRDGLKGKADELANKYGTGTYEEKVDTSGWINDKLDSIQNAVMWDTGTAYKQGASVGAGLQNGINNLFNKAKNNDLLGSLGDKLKLTDLDSITGTGDDDDIKKSLGSLDDNVGGIADSVELTEEDLKYLRDVANMEWKKEFTTANIVVDMKNTNTINNSGDLDGWVETLTNKLYEELDMVADGVYA